MILHLKPADTFFFRDHRPFTAGEQTTANGRFPPPLGTIYGALRSAYIHQNANFLDFRKETDASIKKWMGTPTEKGEFRIKGCFVSNEEQVFLPLPLDYQVVSDGHGGEKALPLELKHESGLSSDRESHKLFGPTDQKSASPMNAYLPLNQWEEHVLHKQSEIPSIVRPSVWLATENKVGIARNPTTHMAEESQLYRIEMLRFKKPFFGFIVPCEASPSFSNVHWARVGGENRPWIVEESDGGERLFTKDTMNTVIEHIQQTGKARIILLTPAVWKHGSRPSVWDPETNHINIGDVSVPLLTAAIGRPNLIGGWDIARNRPKRRKWAVPAGSTLYVEVDKEDAEAFVRAIFEKRINDDTALEKEGYGLAVCAPYFGN